MPPPWSGDCGDGTYRNPILYADYSDPDVVRVGDEFWMTASSFCHVPGLPILHSRDLVNWTLVNHALPLLHPREHYGRPRHGEGVWAPALRYHAGRYWIFYPDPDFGIAVVTTEHPSRPWSVPHLLLPGKGLIDPCPLWDGDGRCYLVHGWARSRAGINNLITLHELSPDGLRVLDAGRTIIDANQMPGWHTLEGPKLYRHDGWYWVFAPAGGVAEGYQAVFRSRHIEGPYEPRIVLAQGGTPINGPHQGAWVDTPRGEHWFIHFQELPAYGRVVHLQPMRWRADGWPEMGSGVNAEGVGQPVLRHPKPDLPPEPPAGPATSDEFTAPALGRQWQWQANPDPAWWSLDPALRRLALRCVPLLQEDRHWSAEHLLLQKFPAPQFTVTVRLRLDDRSDGDRAGLIVFGYDYAWIGLRRTSGRVVLGYARCEQARDGHTEAWSEIAAPWPRAGEAAWVLLRVNVAAGAICRFAWSDGASPFEPVTPAFPARSSRWVGAKVGLFASAAPGSSAPGSAEFQAFLVTAP